MLLSFWKFLNCVFQSIRKVFWFTFNRVFGIFFCHAINLECEFREALASGWENVKSGKECRPKNLVITTPNQEITSINGIAGSDAINNDVRAIPRLKILNSIQCYQPFRFENWKIVIFS
jgi:hypothetical protein